MAEIVGDLVVQITGDYAPLQQDINQAVSVASDGAGEIQGSFNQAAGSATTWSDALGTLADQLIAGTRTAGEFVSGINEIISSQLKDSLMDDADSAGKLSKALGDAGGELGNFLTKSQQSATTPVLSPSAVPDVMSLEQAFARLGVTGSQTLTEQAQQAKVAYDSIASSGKASIADLQQAWISMEEQRQAAAIQSGNIVSQAERDALAQAKAPIEELKQEFTSLDEKIKNVGSTFTDVGGIMTGALTVPLAAISAALIKVGMDMDESSDTIRAKTGLVGEDLQRMNDSFDSVAANVPNKLGDVTAALVTLHGRLGLMGEPLETMATQMLNLSRITGESLNPLVDTSAKMFNRWGLEGAAASTAMDKLYFASTQTGTGVGQMVGTLRQFQPALEEMGFGFDKSVAILATFDKTGLNVQKDMAALQQGLARMDKAGMASPAEGLQLLIDKMTATGVSAAQAEAMGLKVFGKGAIDLVHAIQDGKFNLDEFVSSMDSSSGKINKAATDTLSFADKVKELGNSLSVSARPAGEAFLKVLEDYVSKAKPAIDMVGELSKRFADLSPETRSAVVEIGGIAAATGPGLLVLGKLSTTVADVVKNLKEGSTAWSIFVGGLRTGEIVAVTGALVLLGKAVLDLNEAELDTQKVTADTEARIKATGESLKGTFSDWDEGKAKVDKLRQSWVDGNITAGDWLKGLRDLSEEYRASHPLIEAAATSTTTLGDSAKKAGDAAGDAAPKHKAAADEIGKGGPASDNTKAALDRLLSGHKSTVLSLQDLIDKNRTLNSELTLAQGVYDQVTARVKAGSGEYNLQSEALKQLDAIRKKLGDTETNAGRISEELEQKTQNLINKTFANVDATDKLNAKYGSSDAVVQASMKVRDGLLSQLGLTIDQFNALKDKLGEEGAAHELLQGHIQTTGLTFKDFGITTTAVYKKMADDSKEAYDKIKDSDEASDRDKRALLERSISDNRRYRDSLNSIADDFVALGVKSSQSLKDIRDAGQRAFDDLASAAGRSAGDIVRAMDSMKAKNREYLDSLSPVADAFKNLGIVSSEQLRRIAEDADISAARVSGLGADSARAADVARAAWKRYYDSLTYIPPAEDMVGQHAVMMGDSISVAADVGVSAVNRLGLSLDQMSQKFGQMDKAAQNFAKGVGSFSPGGGGTSPPIGAPAGTFSPGGVPQGNEAVASGDLGSQSYDQLWSDYTRNVGSVSPAAKMLAQMEYQELQRRWAAGDFGSGSAGSTAAPNIPQVPSSTGAPSAGSSSGAAPAVGVGLKAGPLGNIPAGTGMVIDPGTGMSMTVDQYNTQYNVGAGAGVSSGLQAGGGTAPAGGGAASGGLIGALDALSGAISSTAQVAAISSFAFDNLGTTLGQASTGAAGFLQQQELTRISPTGTSGPKAGMIGGVDLTGAIPPPSIGASSLPPGSVMSMPTVKTDFGAGGSTSGSGFNSGLKPTGWTDEQWKAFQGGGSKGLSDMVNAPMPTAPAAKVPDLPDPSKMQWFGGLDQNSTYESVLAQHPNIGGSTSGAGSGSTVNVTINNPTVTNQTQLDQMVSQIQNAGMVNN
jgi:TP901 family phage tail tape measure protein